MTGGIPPQVSTPFQKLKNVRGIRGILYRLGQLHNRALFAVRGAQYFTKIQWTGKQRGASRPLVTAVVTGRNDDYMPDFAQRLRLTIAWNARYLAAEVIFVEWNPPSDRPLLSLDLVQRFPFVRAYVVSSEIHETLSEGAGMPLLEFHAKNVGLRRAQTDWTVTTNADAAFGPDTIHTLLHTPLAEDVVWSAQRIDIPWREGREREIGLFDCLRYRRPIPYKALGTGEFAFASRRLWQRARGYDESLLRQRIGADERGVAQLLAHGGRTARAGTVLHLTHPTSCTEGVRSHHGEWATLEGVPYQNDAHWGLADRQETPIADRVWRIK